MANVVCVFVRENAGARWLAVEKKTHLFKCFQIYEDEILTKHSLTP